MMKTTAQRAITGTARELDLAAIRAGWRRFLAACGRRAAAALACIVLASPAAAGPISAFAGSTATRMALTAPDVSPLAPEELDLRRPALLSPTTVSQARLDWISEDVIRWWRPGVEAGDISSESAGLTLSVPLRTGAIGLELERGWSHASYATDRDAAARLPRERIAAAYGWPAGRGLRLGVALERSESDARVQGTYLGELLNSAPSGRLDLPFKSRTLLLEGRRDWGKLEVALRVNRLDASFPVTLVNGGDTATIDLGHEGLGWGVEAFQRLDERVRLAAFGGSADRSGSGAISYKRADYGRADVGFYEMWVGLGVQWKAHPRTAVWGELLWRETSASAHGLTGVPGPLGFGVPGEELSFRAGAHLSVKSVRAAVEHRRRDGIRLRFGVQIGRIDADTDWRSRWAHFWGLEPTWVSAGSETLHDARLYMIGLGAEKEWGRTRIAAAVVGAAAETHPERGEAAPPEPAPPRPKQHVRGGLAFAAAVTRSW